MALTLQDDVEQQAAEWAVALDRGLRPEEQVSLDLWLAEAPGHQGALVRARAVWIAATGLRQAAHISPAGATLRGSLHRRGLLVGGLAAGIAATFGAGLFLRRVSEVRTGELEIRRMGMADGSQAVLNSRTRLAVHYSENRRQVTLRSGEAWFDVAKDPKRPFVVSTPDVRVTAVGTAFSVSEDAGVAEVVVTEGTVRIEPLGGKARLVSAGGRLRIGGGNSVETRLDAGRMQRRLAWRDGLIMLDGETLADAAAQFNQYGRRKIKVAPDIAGRKVVGVFSINDAEGFARANGSLLSVDIHLDADEIRIGEVEASQKIRNK